MKKSLLLGPTMAKAQLPVDSSTNTVAPRKKGSLTLRSGDREIVNKPATSTNLAASRNESDPNTTQGEAHPDDEEETDEDSEDSTSSSETEESDEEAIRGMKDSLRGTS